MKESHHFWAWPFQSDPHRTLSFSLTSGGKSYVIQWGAYTDQKEESNVIKTTCIQLMTYVFKNEQKQNKPQRWSQRSEHQSLPSALSWQQLLDLHPRLFHPINNHHIQKKKTFYSSDSILIILKKEKNKSNLEINNTWGICQALGISNLDAAKI